MSLTLPVDHDDGASAPAIGFTQEPPQVVNLSEVLDNPATGTPGGPAHIPRTMDYAVRVTQKDNLHFAIDIGVGHVAGVNGHAAVATNLPPPIHDTWQGLPSISRQTLLWVLD